MHQPQSFVQRFVAPLRNPSVIWTIALALAVRLIIINITAPIIDRPDGPNFLLGGSNWLHHPALIYSGIADYVARYHYQPQCRCHG
jgi:hypothetical protein